MRWIETTSTSTTTTMKRYYMSGLLQYEDDPYLMDVHIVDNKVWLAQYSTASQAVRGNPGVRLGPYPTVDEAKAAAEMMYETLVVKT